MNAAREARAGSRTTPTPEEPMNAKKPPPRPRKSPPDALENIVYDNLVAVGGEASTQVLWARTALGPALEPTIERMVRAGRVVRNGNYVGLPHAATAPAPTSSPTRGPSSVDVWPPPPPAQQRDIGGRFGPAQAPLVLPAPPATTGRRKTAEHEAEKVRRALHARTARVAERARRLAEAHLKRREAAVVKLRELARRDETPALVRRIAEGKRRLAKQDREHRARLRELARAGGCPSTPRRRCKKACALRLEGSWCAGDAPLVLPSGPVRARYCLTSAARLIASHDPITWIPRPDYPPDTQERRYEVDPAEQLKIVQISEHMRPEVIVSDSASGLDGPPVVTAEGLVAGGNGRTMAIQRAYRSGHGATLRRYLREHAATFGLRPEDVDRFEDPILVRVVEVDLRALPRLVRDLNQPLTQAMDATAEAVSAARVLPQAALDALAAGIGDDTELAAYLGSPRSLPLVRALEAGGVVTPANRNRLLTPAGLLSEDGRRLVTAQLAAALVPDAGTLEALGQLRGSLARSAPWWLAASAVPGYDVRRAFTLAARDLRRMRAEDLSIRQLRQGLELFGGEASRTAGDRLAEVALEMFDDVGAKPIVFTRIARTYRRMADALGSAPLLVADDLVDELVLSVQRGGAPASAADLLYVAWKFITVSPGEVKTDRRIPLELRQAWTMTDDDRVDVYAASKRG